MNVQKIRDGLVIDHIRAGTGLSIFNWLKLDRVPFSVALIMNALKQMGTKDIIKIDNHPTSIIRCSASSIEHYRQRIEGEHVMRKITLALPERVENVIRCRNPRCITSSEAGIPHVFHLIDRKRAEYACEYCDEAYRAGIGEVL